MKAAVCGALVLVAADVFAAGGHFDVDDAVMLDAGQCQTEAWALRAPTANASLLHLGPGCRVGPVEATVNLERAGADEANQSVVGPQLKWAAPLGASGVAVGAVWAAALDVRHGGRPVQTAYVPLTWHPGRAVQIHVNAGVDRPAGQGTHGRLGAALELSPRDALTLIAERSRILGTRTSRVGGRVNLGAATSVDLSVARAGNPTTPVYAIGLNRTFAR